MAFFAAEAELGLAGVPAVFLATVVEAVGFLATGDLALLAATAVAVAATAAATIGTAAEPASDPIVAAVLDTGLSGWRDSIISATGAGVSC